MRCVVLMFDSLNRHMLPPYHADTFVHAPNFTRLARHTATFDRSFVCSMPCMPARRDFHTGRPNFLHRSWGPLEPFDDSVPQMLDRAGVHTHLATDHQHYFEDGGATYHQRYSTWEFFRGQEGDKWKGQVAPEPADPKAVGRNADDRGMHAQDRVNRRFIRRERDFPQSQTIAAGLDFIERNAGEHNWLAHIETFDPHEPFYAPQRYRDLYAEHFHHYEGPQCDWPNYGPADQPPELVEHMRYEYAALTSFCDAKLGEVLDTFDRLDLWKDTALVVWTDHGFLLGEKDCWAKMWMPMWNEVVHTPLFMWDPRHPEAAGTRRSALVQPSIDLPPTLLRMFGQEPTDDMLGHDLGPVLADDRGVREAAIYGIHGGQINVTDGRWVYMKASADEAGLPLYDYTLMPTRMRSRFSVEEVQRLEGFAEPFSFTKGCPTMKFGCNGYFGRHELLWRDLLYDLSDDPEQIGPLDNPQQERRMRDHLARLMAECDAPREQYERVGLPGPS